MILFFSITLSIYFIMPKPSSNVLNNKSTVSPTVTRYHNNYHSDQSAELLVLAVNKSDKVAISEEDISKDFITDPNNSLGVIQHQTINTVKIIKNLLTIDSSFIYNSIAQYIIDNKTFNFTDIDTITAIVNATVNAIDITINETLKTNMINYIVQSNTLLEEWTGITDSTIVTITSLLQTSSLIIEKSNTLDFTSSLDITAEVLNIKDTFSNVLTYSITLPERRTEPFTDSNKIELDGAINLWQGTYAQREVATALYGPIGEWNMSQMTNMSSLFKFNRTFNSNINDWDVSNVTNMDNMFWYAEIFNQPINKWNTSKVTKMNTMFNHADAFNQDINTNVQTRIDGTKYVAWDVSSVESMIDMLSFTPAFNQPINKWNISNVKNMEQMFRQSIFNQNITENEVTLENGTTYTAWNVSNVTEMYAMFFQHSTFNNGSVDISGNPSSEPQNELKWNTVNVTNMANMFNSATRFNSPVSTWDTSNVINMANMFHVATRFEQEVRTWNIGSVSTNANIFNSATAFQNKYNVGASPSNYFWTLFQGTTETINDITYTYDQNPNYAPLPPITDKASLQEAIALWTDPGMYDIALMGYGPINDWDVSGVTDMSSLFQSNKTFNSNINDWDVSSVTNMENMFWYATIFNQPINKWNTSKVTKMNTMFNHADAFNQDINTNVQTRIDGTKYVAWDVSSVESMIDMLSFTPAFNQPINKWNISNVKNMEQMFRQSIFNQNITENEVTLENGTTYTAWNVSNVTEMYAMFFQHSTFNNGSVDISGNPSSEPQNELKWNTVNVTNMANMFNSATLFNSPVSTWDISNVINMPHMFYGATSFEQEVRTWNIGSVSTNADIFNSATAFQNKYNVGKSPANYFWTLFQGTTETINDITYTYQENPNYAPLPEEITDKATLQGLISMWSDPGIMKYTVTNKYGDINDWDVSGVTNMSSLFQFNRTFNSNINDWDVSSVTNMENMFWYATIFNQPINKWNTSKVTKMNTMFNHADAFNQDINTNVQTRIDGTKYVAWDVSSVESMIDMLSFTPAFNQPINKWNTSNVKNMEQMFRQSIFNQNITENEVTLENGTTYTAWNVSNVTEMYAMFLQHSTFNNGSVDISGNPSSEPQNELKWNTVNVTNMANMFNSATRFNSPVSTWDTSNVINMANMFYGATSFEQEVRTWDVNTASTSSWSNMFNGATAFLETFPTATADPNIQFWQEYTNSNTNN